MSKKIGELDAVTGANAAAGTTVVIEISVDGVSKKMTKAETLQFLASLWAGSSALAGSGVHATEDKIPIGDNAVGKHILVPEVGAALFALASALAGSGVHATQDHLLLSDNGVVKKILTTELQIAMVALATALLGSDAAAADTLLIDDGGVAKKITLEELFSAMVILGVTLADVPEYADQAAAQAGLTGTGRFWRQTTTGLLGITIA